MAPHLTPSARLLAREMDDREAGDLVGAVLDREDAGQTWRDIAFWLHDLTGIRVSHESLRGWAKEWRHQTGRPYPEPVAAEAGAA